MNSLKSTRDGFGEALLELGAADPRVVVLTADLSESMRVEAFARSYPARFIQCGVAEQNMMGIAAGLALSGKIPFVASYAVFSPGRNWDQLRVSVCYAKANVKIIGGHTGLSVGADGATHQALEDLALTRVLPNLTVVVPADAEEARQATRAIAKVSGPVYLRLTREASPVIRRVDSSFVVGEAEVLLAGKDATIIGCGPLLAQVLTAAKDLAENNIHIEVINSHTLKPLDKQTLLASIQKTKAVLTVEDHQINGGLGSAVCELVAENFPVPVVRMGMRDCFGQSGTPAELYAHYHLTAKDIIEQVKRIIAMK